MDEHPIARVRREHRAVRQILLRLERIADGADRSRLAGRRFAAFWELVRACDRHIAPHLLVEERAIYPRLRECLPAENDAVDAAMREHETLRELVGLLRARSRSLRSGARDGEAEIAETIRDLVTLWRAHAHRVDAVVAPLLKRVKEAPHG